MDNLECVLKNIEFELERSADNMELLSTALKYQNKLLEELINVIREKE
jgi:hypothetical protein